MPADPPVASPALPDWTGPYFGVEFGGANVELSAPGTSADDTDLIGGLIVGYEHDFGQWVGGVGLDHDWSNVSISAPQGPDPKLNRLWRLRLQGGYKIGNGLAYGTGGYANAEFTNTAQGSIDDDGYFLGAGYKHRVSERFSLGSEVLYHGFDDFAGTATDADIWSVQIRAAYRY
jgi:hypothetical protein